MPSIQTAIKGVSAGVKARGTGGNQLFVYFGDKRDANNPNNFVFAIDFETNAMVAFIGSIEDNQVDGFSLWNQTDIISLINDWEEDNPSLVNEIESISYLNSELFDIRRTITSNKKVQSSLKGGSMRRRKVQSSPISYKDFTTCVKMCKGLKVYENDENEVMCGLEGAVISLAIVDDNTVRAVTWDDTDNESAKDLEISTLYNQKLLSRSLQDLCNKSGYSSEETKVAVRGALKFLQAFYDKVSPNFDEESSLKGNTMRRRKVQANLSQADLKAAPKLAKTKSAYYSEDNGYPELICGSSPQSEGTISLQLKGTKIIAQTINDEGEVDSTVDFDVSRLSLNARGLLAERDDVEEQLDRLCKDSGFKNFEAVQGAVACIQALVKVNERGNPESVQSSVKNTAQRKLLALAGIRKVTQSLVALAEADEDEQDDLQEEVQDAVEELLENPSDDIEEAIEDITSAMKSNHRVVSGEDDAFYDEDIVDLSEADEDDEDLEDDVVESRFRSRKVQSRMQRKRNVMAELDEEFDGAYVDDITDESDLDEDIYDEDSYEELSSSRRKGRKVGAKTRTSVKSSKVARKRKATASIVAANLAALRNM